jgi:GMP synthase (glutamine-hydrolysing)
MTPLVVLDYGSQYTRLIARRLRELNVYSVILPSATTLEDLQEHQPAGVILSGGPSSVYDESAPQLPAGLMESGLPILAICYGMQLVAQQGGEVKPGTVREYGKSLLENYQGELFDTVEGDFIAWMSHGDSVAKPPQGFTVTAATSDTPIAAMENTQRKIYCIQFHPEVHHTPKGVTVLENFIAQTGLKRDWTSENILEQLTREAKEKIGGEKVLLAISGGVDSSTLGLLLNRAIGKQLFAVFVDHGLLRLGEAEEVEKALRGLGVNLTVVNAEERFLSALKGVSDPEEKRKIIGREFIEVFNREAQKLQAEHGNIKFL